MPELSGIEVSVIVKEISEALRGAYINNIFSVGEAQLLRFRQPGGGDVWVVASPKYGAWVSEKVSERAETTEFTTRLRQELGRAKVEGVSQVDLDRIYEFSAVIGDGPRRLVLELMPPGNILVLGEGGRIRAALRESRSARRTLVEGGSYMPPAQSRLSPAEVTPSDVAAILKTEETVGKAIGRNLALPRKYVEAVLRKLSVVEGTPSSALASRTEEVSGALRDLVADARSNPKPCLCETSKGLELFAVPPGGLVVYQSAATMSALCDELFLPLVMGDAEKAAAPLATEKGEIQATLARMSAQEAGLTEKAKKVRAVTAQVRGAESLDEAWKIALPHLPAGRAPMVKPSSQAAVASLLFDRAKELERRAEEVKGAARTLQRRLARAKVAPGRRNRELRRTKQEWYEKFRWFHTSQGRLAIGGRDAQSNGIIVRRHLESNDTVYHADLFGSPFFVLKNGRDQSPEEVLEVAQATVSFSSAWKTGLGAADAYWVSPDQVSASAPSGEYLPRGSFLIKGKKNSVLHLLVQLAVGVDKDGRIVSGPESAVARMSASYVVLLPQKEKTSDTARKVAKELGLLGSGQSLILDDVIRALPAGGGKLVRKKAAPDKESDTQ